MQYITLEGEVQNAMHLVWLPANLTLASTDKYMHLLPYLAAHGTQFTLIALVSEI